MKNFGGMSWTNDGTGRVLFRPDPKASTFELSEVEFQRAQKAKSQELFVALITGLPIAVMVYLLLKGGLNWPWLISGCIAYGAFNTIFYLRSRNLIRDLVRNKPVSAEQLPPVDAHEVLGKALRLWVSHMGGVIRFMGWALGVFGLAFMLLGAVMNGNPGLWIGTILFAYLFWEFVWRRRR